MEKALPAKFKKYFWDCDFTTLNMKEHSFFISERILNFGNDLSLKWLLSKINKEQLTEVVERSRNLDKKTKNYWNLML